MCLNIFRITQEHMASPFAWTFQHQTAVYDAERNWTQSKHVELSYKHLDQKWCKMARASCRTLEVCVMSLWGIGEEECVCVRAHSLWNADLSQQGPEDKERLVSAPPGQVTQSIFTFSPSPLIPSLLHSSPLAVFLVSHLPSLQSLSLILHQSGSDDTLVS